MEEADNCRRAAREAVTDVEPPRLHDLVETVLEDASMIPGTLTIRSATAAAPEAGGSLDDQSTADLGRLEIDSESVFTHAAGVQLIYEGLRLTRTLAHEEPWTEMERETDAEESDLEILAADILVARGFYLLARTDAAGKAVRTVQAFGHDQARRTDLAEVTRAEGGPADPVAIDANLERDVLELAVRTGAAAVNEPPSTRLLAFAEELATDVAPSFPPAEKCLDEFEPSASERSLEDHTTDRATSATDP